MHKILLSHHTLCVSSLKAFCIFRYLEKTFSRAVKYSQPHVIAFLGDLMDEGHISNAEDFERYKRRLDSIFTMPDDIMVRALISLFYPYCLKFLETSACVLSCVYFNCF